MSQMNPTVYIGIDPGVTGAIAFYCPTFRQEKSLVVYDMPTQIRTGTRREVHPFMLAQYIRKFQRFRRVALIEKVGAMTGREDGASMFQFGRSFGICLGALAAHEVTYFETRPAVWKAMLCLGKDKEESLTLARSLFPKHHHYFQRKKDNGRAEAALLAHLCAQTQQLGMEGVEE